MQCDNESLIRLCYDVGSKGIISFTQPVNDLVPLGWNDRIRPPVPLNDLLGNPAFEIRRRKGDTRKITAPKYPKLDSKRIQIWDYPQVTDLASRRLIVCANKIRCLEDVANELRRYVLARVLAPPSKPNDLFELYRTPEKAAEFQLIIERVTANLSKAQKRAVQFCWDIVKFPSQNRSGKQVTRLRKQNAFAFHGICQIFSNIHMRTLSNHAQPIS